jgi:hypothetical protein
MKQRGRKSAEQQAVVAPVVIQGSFGQRPDPPADMNERQREIWRETVACEPADFFNTAAVRALLKTYCEHREAAEKLTVIINSFLPEWIKTAEGARRYRELLHMRDMENRAAGLAATRLRLTNQSRYTPQASATASRNALRSVKPWES